MMTLTIALAGALILDGSVRAEARGGPTAGTEDPTSAGVSADLQGRLPDADVPLRFGLTPSAVLAQGSQLFIRGFGEAGLRLGGGASARLRQAFGYGTIDQSPVAPGAGPGARRAPPGRRVPPAPGADTSPEID